MFNLQSLRCRESLKNLTREEKFFYVVLARISTHNFEEFFYKELWRNREYNELKKTKLLPSSISYGLWKLL